MSELITQDAVTLTSERDLNLWQAAPALYAACRAAAIALATVPDGEQVRFARQVVEAALDRVAEADDAATGAAAAPDPRPSTRAEKC